jgi:hypothetical protein
MIILKATQINLGFFLIMVPMYIHGSGSHKV